MARNTVRSMPTVSNADRARLALGYLRAASRQLGELHDTGQQSREELDEFMGLLTATDDLALRTEGLAKQLQEAADAEDVGHG